MRLSAILIIVTLLSGLGHWWQIRREKALADQVVILTDQNEKLTDQVKAVQWEDANVIQVTHQTYESMVSGLKHRLDSVTQANHIKTNDVISATVISSKFEDETDITAVVGKVIQEPGKPIKVPVSYDSECWGMQGDIVTNDPCATFIITDRKANNAFDLIVTKPRRFLGFLWKTKHQSFKLLSDCGEATISGIKFEE